MAWSKKQMGDTRREREGKLRRTFGPLERMIADLKQGEIDAIKGEPVLAAWGEYMSVAHTLDGWHGCFSRIIPHADLGIFLKVGKKLEHGIVLEMHEVHLLEQAMQECKRAYMHTPLIKLRSAILSAQIAFEIEAGHA